MKNLFNIQSDLHKEAVLKIELSTQDNVYSLLNTQAMADQKVRRQMLLMQLSSLKYLLRQGLAFRGHESVAAELTIQYLLRLRSDASFDQFYTKVAEDSKDLTSSRVA